MKSRLIFLWTTLGVLLIGAAALSSIPLVDAAPADLGVAAAADQNELQPTPLSNQADELTVSRVVADDECFDYTGSPTDCPEPELVTYCTELEEKITVPADEVPEGAKGPGDAILGTVEAGFSYNDDCIVVINGFCYFNGTIYEPTVNFPASQNLNGLHQPGDTVDGGTLGPNCELIPDEVLGSISGSIACEGQTGPLQVDLVQDMGNLIIASTTISPDQRAFGFTDLPLGTYGVVADGCNFALFGIELTVDEPDFFLKSKTASPDDTE